MLVQPECEVLVWGATNVEAVGIGGRVPLSGPFPFWTHKSLCLSRIRLRTSACTRYRDTTEL